MTKPVFLHNYGLTSALGIGKEAHRQSLWDAAFSSPLTVTDDYSPGQPLPVGRVNAPLPDTSAWSEHECSRNNQILWSAWQQIADDWQAIATGVDLSRVAVIIGTSTSGISESEACFAPGMNRAPDYAKQQIAAPAAFLAQRLGVTGPAYTLSTACTSGAKALASGRRLLNAGLVDWVIAGGADALCALTVRGFGALEAISASPCNPMSVNRNGINIGEGAALFLMSREPGPIALLGVGESSDAHHISAPDPEGHGAERALNGALADAALDASFVTYLNLHGTATALNDKMESFAVQRVLGTVKASSTKPFTGHTLGAAGALEAGICALALQAGRLPPHRWDGEFDPELASLQLVAGDTHWPESAPRIAMSSSFAFGGNNIALLLAQGDDHDQG
ncbi:beta-ketoacyl-ACP synthase [Simiduia agarivorans]|uniref:3-ketoacyl-ACP synthase I n=1 Tax=Simiduia agarivorans (strain DSM 21679 / JCM 13881 / BCRC 17597 / SA1) TaxID=1117647 RepID=K4KK25_SIMAS|nr:beta-ketoacyl-ACP synthase [Simiduia agarivorans]AFU98580.1 3-ketoacyl-ACP synthase I [Simiduia agarivorans SA1 = DSM 21679]